MMKLPCHALRNLIKEAFYNHFSAKRLHLLYKVFLDIGEVLGVHLVTMVV